MMHSFTKPRSHELKLQGHALHSLCVLTLTLFGRRWVDAISEGPRQHQQVPSQVGLTPWAGVCKFPGGGDTLGCAVPEPDARRFVWLEAQGGQHKTGVYGNFVTNEQVSSAPLCLS